MEIFGLIFAAIYFSYKIGSWSEGFSRDRANNKRNTRSVVNFQKTQLSYIFWGFILILGTIILIMNS